MRTSRLWRPAAAGRAVVVVFLITIAFNRAAAAATISGRVTDSSGAPVGGAHVVVTSPLGTVADRTTDRAGSFTIDSLAAGTYEIRALADGLQADPMAVALAAEETRTIDVTLHLSAITESIVVSAAQVDVPLSRAADSVTVITAADLQARQIETVADALRFVPALGVTRSGGRGAITSLFPRGGGSNYTLVLIDGMRVNAFGGGYDFAHLPAGDVERIEVVRGPESALFGSEAIGAVVQVVTKRGGRPHGDALVEAGNQGTRRAVINASGSVGGWTWGGAAEQSRTDGFTGTAPATGERVTNDDDHLRRASGSLGWQRPGGPDVLVSGNIARDERGFPGPFGTNPIGAFTAVDRVSRGVNHTRQIGTRVGYPWTPRVRQRIDVNLFDLSSDFISRFGTSDSRTRRVDLRLQEDMAFTPVVGASAGVEFQRERGSSTFVTGPEFTEIPIYRSVAGTFAEFRYASRERLFVTAGLRLEHLTRDALEPDAFSTRPPFPEQSIDSLNPKLAVSYRINGARVHASAGTGIRPPNVFEIAFTDNPNLKPERSRSFEAGVDQTLAGGALALRATAFFNRYDDLLVTIERSLRDASRYKTDNVSNARARGLELAADARPLRALTARATYTLLGTEILSVDGLVGTAPPPFKVGDPLLRRPRHQGALDLVYAHRRVTAFVDLTTRSRTLDVEPSFGSSRGLFFSSGYAVANAGMSVRVAPAVDVYGRVLNVTDRAYEEALGFPALRRSALIGVRIAASR